MENFVFDLYGTLVDIHTDEGAQKFKQKTAKYFARLNPRVTDFFALYKRLCAEKSSGENCEIDLLSVFREILTYGGNAVEEGTVLKAAEYFRKQSRSRLKLYRGVRALLKGLRMRGARLYILSNAQSCFTVKELEKLKLTEWFDGIEISSDFGRKKPAPEFFRHIIDKYSLDPEKTVYVGNDFKADILGAKSASLCAAYIKSNLSPAEDDLAQIKKTADFATDDFSELFEYLLSFRALVEKSPR